MTTLDIWWNSGCIVTLCAVRHGNKIAARSSEEVIPVGTNVKVIEADYWSFGSLVRNSPVLKVVPFEGDTGLSLDDGTEGHEKVEPEVVDNVLDTEKVNEGMGLKSAANWTVRFLLILTGVLSILFGLNVLPIGVLRPSELNILLIFLYPITETFFSLYPTIRSYKYC